MKAETLYLFTLIFSFIIKIVAMMLGFYVIKFGIRLVRDGIKGKFRFMAKFKGFGADLYSMSPGLLFVFLGIVLIISTVGFKKEFHMMHKYYNKNIQIPVDSLPTDTL